ncbi:MAG: sulfite reductase (ferredoxin) [Arcobacteraceae bacterium]|jgi:sulfite reductase (ferredoxin)
MARETAAQRIQRIKEEKNGLDVLADIKRYAADSTIEIDPEDIDRFKWYGLYTQNKNLQPEGDENLYFMLRIKLEKGAMNLEQMREVSAISSEFAKKQAAFTTRQDIQLHNVSVTSLPTIFDRLQTVGLSSIYGAGDVPRNVTTCPVMGIDHNELIDVNETVSAVNDYFRGNKDLVNLPRKYKVGISACSKHCMGHEIQDLSFTAVNFGNEVLFDVSVGGGLASNKEIATHIGYVTQDQILDVVKAVTLIYRDHGLRENRRKARLGHLIASWGIEKFVTELENDLGFKLQETKVQDYTVYSKREHFGVHSSKIENISYIGCAINGGKIGADGLNDLANTLEEVGATSIKATSTQNFIITDVPTKNTQQLVEKLALYKIDADPSPFKARTLSCTGLNFCKFAISETKDKAMELSEYLEEKFPDFKDTLSISVNGCPNSCAHPHIVDIGLLGLKVKDEEGNTVPGFELILGGNLEGEKSSFGEKTKLQMRPDQVNGVVERIVLAYIASNHTVIHEFMKEMSSDQEFISTLI